MEASQVVRESRKEGRLDVCQLPESSIGRSAALLSRRAHRPIQIEFNLPYSYIGEIMEEHVHISISHARQTESAPAPGPGTRYTTISSRAASASFSAIGSTTIGSSTGSSGYGTRESRMGYGPTILWQLEGMLRQEHFIPNKIEMHSYESITCTDRDRVQEPGAEQVKAGAAPF
ncbi:hypothetical protein SUGI_1475700 [Cryptomeria japonica]|uniref:Uncharacterized protein n=1 Tax=Cryptomeria japonica TaxID=3369 RepID=A0AAD3RQY9_CRYJA|nr:hypothetical protein SUGI_1467110 [Cryptomeria japonica]GLJ58775.1 hypothetical protein SUGI_1475700 [Cryptomeria japonica]